MTKNIILRPKTQIDIDNHVDRVLKGLGNPEPPLRLEDVRHLLKLDRGFYTANDPGLAQEALSRIRVATVQIMERPTLIWDAIKAFSLKALYIPDRKRILLDGDVPPLKHRWNEAHEIGHSILPWHGSMMHGDNDQTLSRECEAHIEAEANFAAGKLLFLRNRFVEEARSSATKISSIQALHKTYGNTLASTLFRFVESAGEQVPLVGMMTCHPHVDKRPKDFDPLFPCKYLIQSSAFKVRFGKIQETALFSAVANYCGRQSGGPLGHSELLICDDNGESHRFYFETFFNRYDALTLGVYIGRKPTAVSMI